jgi:uncharacterized membrane protein
MRRVSIVFAILSVLLLADGTWMELTHYQPGDQNPLFGNPHLIISDGTTVLVAAGMLLVVAAVMWVAGGRREQRHHRHS